MATVESKQPCFFWLDLEMTGLDPANDRILEAGVIVTDASWNELHTWESAVHQPPETLASMNDWCQKHHRESGLLARVPEGISEVELDRALAACCRNYWGDIPVILCGNSIHQDRRFVDRWLPEFAACLHYRMLDVSSFKVVFSELYGITYSKKNAHRALDDIRESIAEFRFYQSAIRPTS